MLPILEAKIVLMMMVWKVIFFSQSADVLKSPTINNNSVAPKLAYIHEQFFVKFDGSCQVKQNGSAFNKNILNICC